MQHLSENHEGPKLSEEQSALSLLVDDFTVVSPVQSIIQVFAVLHHHGSHSFVCTRFVEAGEFNSTKISKLQGH